MTVRPPPRHRPWPAGLGCHEHRGGGEQVRAAALDPAARPSSAGLGFELLAQALGVEAETVANAVERLRDRERSARAATP